MNTTLTNSIRHATAIRLGLLVLTFIAPGTAVRVYADAFFVPSVSLAAVHDDNIFVTAGVRAKDLITRATPGLETGYESANLDLRANYNRDLEKYADHPDLNSNSMRQFGNASINYQASTAILLSFDAAYSQSRVPSDLNISSGVGIGRLEGKRHSANPAIEYRFSETSTGLVEYFLSRESIAEGIEGDTNQINGEFEHAINSTNQLIYGYTYSKYEFTNGLTQNVHTPRVGFGHDFSNRTSLEAQAGPRIEEDDVDFNTSVIMRHIYGSGQFSLRYDRDVTTLIGEAGIVQAQIIGATLVHRIGNSFELTFSPSFGEVSRPNTRIQDAEVYRVGLEGRYDFNDAFSLFGSFNYSYQESSFEDFDPVAIPRNLFTLGMTLRLPHRSSSANAER